jgi:hypothetical protein
MFGRFLSFLGFIPGLSGLSGFASGYGSGVGMGAGDDLEADGEAAVSFTPGKALSSADAEETPDSRRERITDRDLVWPGKVETIQINNPEPIAYRFDLTVTDLNPAFYIRRPPLGGVPQREGGVLLQPGDGASFEVVFVPPPTGEKLKTRTFSFVLTCFDPRRSGDPGEIVQDLPLRWVALPTESDLQITAVPPVVVTRPWRREAKFAVRFANKSFLPPTVGMAILRAPNKEALEREAETVGAIQQALAARTPGAWQCLLPPASRRGSYYATVRGAAQAAESVSTPLALPRPVLIRYVPWLRMGRDWAALLGTLLFLFWLVWGFPVKKTPVVRVTLNFGGLERGQMPPDSQPKDLSAQMVLLDERGHDLEGQAPISGIVVGDAYEFTGPSHWYGFRWFSRHPWWNHWSQETQRFRVTVAAAEAEKNAFKRYDLNALQADGRPAYSATDSASPFGSLVMPATFTAPAVHGVLVNLQMGHLGALAGKDLRKVTIRYMLDGQEQPPRIVELIHDTSGGLRPITLDLTDAVPLGGSKTFTVNVTADGLSSYDVQERQVQRGKPLPITLTFPDSYPKAASRPAGGTGTGGQNGAGQNGAGQNPGGSGAGGPRAGGQTGGIQPPVPPHGPIVLPRPIKPIPRQGKSLAANNSGTPSGIGRPLQPFPFQPTPIPTTRPQFHPTPITPQESAAPPTPDGLKAEHTSPSQIYVHWNRVPGATKYVLYRSGGSGSGKGEEHLSGDETSFSDSGLTPGVVYKYRIQSKRGTLMSQPSDATLALTPPLVTAPAKVTLTVSAEGRDVHAVLDFANVSSQTVYLDKVSACAGHKIGDDVFRVLMDSQPLPFTGQKSKRRSDPGPRQFITLRPGESVRQDVILNRSYRFPSGAHVYSVTYSAPHDFPGRLQRLALTSEEVRVATTR